MTSVQPRPCDDGVDSAGGSPPEGLSAPFFADPELIWIALEAGHIGIWTWDIASNRATWSSNVEEICGLPKGGLDDNGMIFEKTVHPEDKPAVIAAMQDTLRTRVGRRMQYRLLPRPGASGAGSSSRRRHGRQLGVPVKLLGICRDVTDRSRMHHGSRVFAPASRRRWRGWGHWR